MNTFSYVPPGFRFHPTDKELVDYYLRKKVASKKIDLDVIKDVDLYKIEPWDLQEKCKIGSEEQSEWYFFSHKDKKYPTGTRTNRATAAGFWKATGRDKPIHVKHCLVGMRKTLVYYKGRAPNGHKSDWIMHEYRLETNEHGTTHHEEGWVVCRVFKKRVAMTMVRRTADESPCWFDNHVGFMPELDTSIAYHKPELEYHQLLPQGPFLQLPQLESPKHPTYLGHGATTLQPSTLTHDETARCTAAPQPSIESVYLTKGEASIMDWRALDKFVASQLSHDEAPLKESTYSNLGLVLQIDKQEEGLDYTSTSASIGGENKMWN